ncbi:MAG: type II toxin-antitoxin system RelE/ParE family toxin [Thermoleophilia bacterium]|nr:type II toxin-antitoxin system RelE/ParE family toxin [Thermoleophilia bacterium]
MIVSFGDRATEDLYHNRPTSRVRRFPRDIIDLALIKLDMLNAAAAVLDLRSPPGNRLEVLKGDLKGFHSIRVNDQWRLAFRWEGNNAHDVRLMDYHR